MFHLLQFAKSLNEINYVLVISSCVIELLVFIVNRRLFPFFLQSLWKLAASSSSNKKGVIVFSDSTFRVSSVVTTIVSACYNLFFVAVV